MSLSISPQPNFRPFALRALAESNDGVTYNNILFTGSGLLGLIAFIAVILLSSKVRPPAGASMGGSVEISQDVVPS